MDKIKSFVIKYQLWFKLAAIVLLVGMFFIPFATLFYYDQADSVSFLFYVKNYEYKSSSYLWYDLAIIQIILTVIISVSIFVSIFNQKFIIYSLFLYLPHFLIYFIAFFQGLITYEIMTEFIFIPNIAFFLSLILLIFDIISIVFWKKNHHSASTKNERIAELEKRLAELEFQNIDNHESIKKDGK